MAQILLENKCDPNKMNSKAQSPLMIALETGNFILVDYLINNAKIHISSDISLDGKTLLHYFAMKCEEYDLIQALLKLVGYFLFKFLFFELFISRLQKVQMN
jgi:ankyrin repeat protein